MIDSILTPGLVKELDRMSIPDIEATYGPGKLVTEYSQPFGHWTPGDGKPTLTIDGPAAAQAVGRCVASRTRFGEMVKNGPLSAGSIHPSKCGWCDYPQPQLLRALDHAIFVSAHVASEYLVWESRGRGEMYTRATNRAGEYRNPEWAEFWRGVTPSTQNAAPSDLTYWSRLRREAVEAARVPA